MHEVEGEIMEKIIMDLIMKAGDAKGECMFALEAARKGEFFKAKNMLEKANKKIVEIHRLQSELMQRECKGEKIEVTILLVHAQDHLTNALVTYDLVDELVMYMEEINGKINK